MSDPTLASHLRIITQLVEYAESKDVRADSMSALDLSSAVLFVPCISCAEVLAADLGLGEESITPTYYSRFGQWSGFRVTLMSGATFVPCAKHAGGVA